MQYDEPAEVLTNYDYCLFDKKYEAVLRQLDGQVKLFPVTVTDGARDLLWDHYIEVCIYQSADSDMVATGTTQGLGIYRFGQEYVFVSEALKESLEKVNPTTLHFSLGLSEFAA